MITLTVTLILIHGNNKTLTSKRTVGSPLTLVIPLMWQHYGNTNICGNAFGNTNTNACGNADGTRNMAIVVTLSLMPKILGSNLSRDDDYLGRKFSWFFSVLTGKYQDIT